MFGWRNALILGLIFVVVGSIYWYVQGDTTTSIGQAPRS